VAGEARFAVEDQRVTRPALTGTAGVPSVRLRRIQDASLPAKLL